MAYWVRGSDLPQHLQSAACARFLYRNTVENRQQRPHLFRGSGAMATCTIPPITDKEWLARSQFAVLRDGSRFNARISHCRTDFGTTERTPSRMV